MSDFGERVKSKLSKMTAAQAPAAPSAYDAVLAEFVRRLNEADLNLHAEVEPREPPQRRLIITWPKYRRTNPMILLSFWIDGPRIHVLGEGKRELASVEDLEAFLDNFLDHSHFPETIDAYREIAQSSSCLPNSKRTSQPRPPVNSSSRRLNLRVFQGLESTIRTRPIWRLSRQASRSTFLIIAARTTMSILLQCKVRLYAQMNLLRQSETWPVCMYSLRPFVRMPGSRDRVLLQIATGHRPYRRWC